MILKQPLFSVPIYMCSEDVFRKKIEIKRKKIDKANENSFTYKHFGVKPDSNSEKAFTLNEEHIIVLINRLETDEEVLDWSEHWFKALVMEKREKKDDDFGGPFNIITKELWMRGDQLVGRMERGF